MTTLHSFNWDGVDGYNPVAGLLRDSAGNLYGTTLVGGKYDRGSVYRVTPMGQERVLYNFDTSGDGGPTHVALVMDRLGNLYGSTLGGGTYGYGTIFEITAGGGESILYNFGAAKGDSIAPSAGLVMDAKGDLYGTTLSGGAYDQGTIFRVTHSGTETIMHSFQNNGTDGYNSYAPLVRDAAGNLYGVTYSGGQHGFGTVFEFSASGVESILHAFANDGTDGMNPIGGLLLDSAGNLYGTTINGGVDSAGTVFEVTP